MAQQRRINDSEWAGMGTRSTARTFETGSDNAVVLFITRNRLDRTCLHTQGILAVPAGKREEGDGSNSPVLDPRLALERYFACRLA